MGLQLILGKSGSGKSYTLYEEVIKESMENRDTNYIIIVPEQFTMQTQKDLVTMHPDHGIMNIDILSFLRLAYRVFEETNTTKRLVLEDTGKSMILRKVIEEKKEELKLFQKNVHKQGFISELKSFLSELYQYSIGPEELEEMIGKVKAKPMLEGKLKDMLTIYEGFKEFIRDKYITAEEILDLLCDVLDQSSIIKNSVICFDGYTGFTPIQNKLVQQLMRLCKKVIVTVTIDERESITKVEEEFKLFHLSQKTIIKLHELATEYNIEVEDPIYVRKGEVPYRYLESKPLAFLEHNLFRYPFSIYEEAQEEIRILVAKDPAQEVAATIGEILRLVSEEGYRYKDIAVVTGDLNSYGKIIGREYEKAKIPCFIDLKKGILGNPLVELMDAILDMMSKDFSYESVFRYLRNGLLEYRKEDVDILENYTIAVGIRGFKGWSNPWTRIYRSKGEVDLEALNEIREQIIMPLCKLREVLAKKQTTIREMTEAIYGYFIANQMEEKVLKYCQIFDETGRPLLAKEYKQVYGGVIELFDKLVDLLGDDVVTIKEYKELLDSGLAEVQVGLIPPGIDQVVVGDIERTRLKDIKALFFIGVNDGIVPKSGNQGGIISDMERELLASQDMVMAPTKRQNAYTEQLYLYLNLTKPTKLLYVTYSKVGSNGKALRASYLIGKMTQLFPLLQIEDLEVNKEEDLRKVVGADRGLSYLIHGLRNYREEMPDVWKELYTWYKKNDENGPLIDLLLEGAFYESHEVGISKAIADALYGKDLRNSVTRLEKYAACAYAHFLSYGLEVEERRQYQISAPDIGTIFHEAMELFAKKLQASTYDWTTIPEDVRDQIVTESVYEAATDYNNTILLSSKRNEYMIKRVERITKRTVWALCEHVKKGDFVPEGFELQFSRLDDLQTVNVELEKDKYMQLQGRIDRVDKKEEDDSIYVRVIDYKSGSTAIDMTKLYYGLQLQLVVYLSAALELEEKKNPNKVVIPAGIFYYNIDDPIVGKEIDRMEKSTNPDGTQPVHSKEWEELIQSNILKELKMNGFVNKNEKVIKAMDHSFQDEEEEETLKGSVKSQVIPVETTKDGALGKRSSTLSNQEFAQLRGYVMNKVKSYGQGIIHGDTCIAPYKLGDRTACDYCEFNGICGFDQRLPGNTYRKLTKLDDKGAMELIKECMNETKNEEEE